MIVVGLDLSLTSAGIAILRDGVPRVITTVPTAGNHGANYQRRNRGVRGQNSAIVRLLIKSLGDLRAIDLAVMEGPSYASRFGDHFDYGGLWHGVYGALDAIGIVVPVAVVPPKSLKLWWTGAGNADKLRMLDTSRMRYRPAISTHDEADAIALAAAGAWHLGDPVPFEPCQRSIDALARVDWPAAVVA